MNNQLELQFDPIQATYRGGLDVPLHDWYPYLEGYSPKFVECALDAFATNAKHVLDPFAGSGTTPLTVARRGLRGTYCELNPLLQFLVETKAEVLALSSRDRGRVARHLLKLADNLRSELNQHIPDRRLEETYTATFGTSSFYAVDAFRSVLRLRSWLDSLDCIAPKAADLATAAVVASLIPASNLVRRGDLRFRKGPAETRLIVDDLVGEVASRLRMMATDLDETDGIEVRPLLIAADAKRLNRISPLGADAVLTSPPYRSEEHTS